MDTQKSLSDNDIVTQGRVSADEISEAEAALENLAANLDANSPDSQVSVDMATFKKITRAFLALQKRVAPTTPGAIKPMASDRKQDYINNIDHNDNTVDIGVNRDRSDSD